MNKNVLCRMTSDYCRIRLAPGVPPLNLLQIRAYLVDLIDRQTPPPQRSNGFDWSTIAEKCGLERPMTPSLIAALRPVLELLQREVPKLPQSADKRREPKARRRSIIKDDRATAAAGRPKTKPAAATAIAAAAPDKCGKPGLPPRPVIEFPVAIWDHWDEPDTFSEALALHMKRHGDTCWHLHRAVVREKEVFDRKTLYSWRAGTRVPRSTESLKVLARIERRYRLPAGYFSSN